MHAGLSRQHKWKDCSSSNTDSATLAETQLKLLTAGPQMHVSCPWVLLAVMAAIIIIMPYARQQTNQQHARDLHLLILEQAAWIVPALIACF